MSRLRDLSFNIPLWSHRAANVSIGSKQVINADVNSRQPVSSWSVDNTGWNILLNQDFVLEQVEYDQYLSEQQWNYEYTIVGQDGTSAASRCIVNDLGLDNTEVSRTEIALGSGVSASVEDLGEWLATQVVCNITSNRNSWQLELKQQENEQPKIQLTGTPWTSSATVLNDSFVGQPGVGGLESSDDGPPISNYLSGVAIASQGNSVSATSLINGNQAIWLAPTLSDNDRVMLLAANYGLILHRWNLGG